MAALVSGVVTAGLPAGAMGGWVEAGAANLASLNPSDVHILLVDDEQLSRMVVTNLLRKCGYKGERLNDCLALARMQNGERLAERGAAAHGARRRPGCLRVARVALRPQTHCAFIVA